MIPDVIVAQQLNRLSILRYFPGEGDDLKTQELARALKESSANPDHCRRIVDNLIRKHRTCPAPADIYETAQQTSAAPDEPTRIDKGCKLCFGTGRQIGWELVTYTPLAGGGNRVTRETVPDQETYDMLRRSVDNRTQFVYDGVRPSCVCRRNA